MGDMLRARKLLSSVISGKAEEVRKVLQTNPELVRNACIDCKGLMYKCINVWTEMEEKEVSFILPFQNHS